MESSASITQMKEISDRFFHKYQNQILHVLIVLMKRQIYQFTNFLETIYNTKNYRDGDFDMTSSLSMDLIGCTRLCIYWSNSQ